MRQSERREEQTLKDIVMNIQQVKLPTEYIFKGQLQHILLLACLVPGAVYLANPALGDGSWLGISDQKWFYAAITLPVIHQIVVWFGFRFQLVFSLFSKLFGKNDMLVWGLIFFPLLILRPLLILALGIADYCSIKDFRSMQIITGIFLMIPAAYTGWSIKKYFGMQRAMGGDHFRQEYRNMPFVKEGAFKYSPNAMYTFGFLFLWAIALLTGSRAALASTLFQHAYIWVHMYCTEAPDMQVIYGNRNG